MENEIDKYEDIYKRLKRCFDISFGNGKKPGLIPMSEVRKLVYLRRKPDFKNNMPENSLIEIPTDIYGALKDTYISRDSSYVSGFIGCAETPEEQLDGITNMTLLMYMSNHLAKEYKHKFRDETSTEKRKVFKKNERTLLDWKDIALSDIIASTYVLEKTSDEFENYFSYGSRIDDANQSTFVMDLPYIGQLCVHFGWDERKDWIVERAQNSVKSILEKKLELGQITEEKVQEITAELEQEGVLPEYEGKLYEFVGAMPIEYIGENTKKYRKIIGNKLPEDITSEDIEIMKNNGLNQRELYYFFIKMGASKDLLNEISGISKKVTPQTIENDTDDITIEEFNEATQDLKDLALGKGQEKTDPNIRT